MIGYLYQITNKVNGKKYIGKTNNIERRISRHFLDLKNGNHHSIKLQRAYNKYGKDNFKITYEIFEDITEEKLALKEIELIQKYDSFYNGYNLTLGGEGHSVLFDFETSLLIYQIGQRYIGIKHMLARYFNCDRTVISSIMNKDLYSKFEYNEDKIEDFLKKIGISDEYLKENYKDNFTRKLNKEKVFQILAAIELQNIGQKVCAEAFSAHKDVISGIIRGKTYKKDKEEYEKLSLQDKQEYLNIFLKDTKAIEISKITKKACGKKMTQDMVNYILNNQSKKNFTELGKELGIDRKRVSRIINHESHLDLIKNWENLHS